MIYVLKSVCINKFMSSKMYSNNLFTSLKVLTLLNVIMYSIGNEVAEPGEEKGLVLEKEMIEIIHGLDKTRAVTCGMNLMIIKMISEGKGVYKEEDGRNEDPKALPNSSKLFDMITSQLVMERLCG